MGFDLGYADGLRDAVRGVLAPGRGRRERARRPRAGSARRSSGRANLPFAWQAYNCIENHDLVLDADGDHRKPRIARLADCDQPALLVRAQPRARGHRAAADRPGRADAVHGPGVPRGQAVVRQLRTAADRLIWWDGLEGGDRHMADFHRFTPRPDRAAAPPPGAARGPDHTSTRPTTPTACSRSTAGSPASAATSWSWSASASRRSTTTATALGFPLPGTGTRSSTATSTTTSPTRGPGQPGRHHGRRPADARPAALGADHHPGQQPAGVRARSGDYVGEPGGPLLQVAPLGQAGGAARRDPVGGAGGRRGRRPSPAGARAPRRAGGGAPAGRRRPGCCSRSSPARGPSHHRDRDGVVERDHRVRRDALEQLVQGEDLRPVGVLGARRLGVHRGDRRLQLVRPEPAPARARR